MGFIFVIQTLFLEQSVVVCKTASTSQLAGIAKMGPRLSTSTALLVERGCVVVKRAEIELRELGKFYVSIRAAEQRPAGLGWWIWFVAGSEGATAGRKLFFSSHLSVLVGHRPLTRPGGYAIQGHPLDTHRCEVGGRSCAAESNSATFRSDQIIFIATHVFLLLSGKNRNIIKPINCQKMELFDSYHFFHPLV